MRLHWPDSDIKGKTGYSPVIDWGYYDEDPQKNDGKVNVLATRKPKEHLGKSLILNGHVDVVPTGPDHLWTNPPFSPLVKNGRLYGRGAGDMKAGIVAYYHAYSTFDLLRAGIGNKKKKDCFFAGLILTDKHPFSALLIFSYSTFFCFVNIEALLSLGVAPAAAVQMQTVVEEECTGNGALVIADQLKADAVLIPEPFNHMIVTGQLGVLWMRVSVQGKPAHVLDTSAGINALDAAYYLVQSLKSLEEEWNEPERRPELWRSFKHPINFNFGTISGGEWPSSVPAYAEFQLRIGFFPNQSISDVKKEVEAALEAAAKAKNLTHKIVYNGFQAEGAAFPTPDSEFFQALGKVHEDVMDEKPKFGALTCTTDGRFFQLYHGMPTTCYGPESSSIHGIDESVSLDSMHNVARVIALFIARWCKLEKI